MINDCEEDMVILKSVIASLGRWKLDITFNNYYLGVGPERSTRKLRYSLN